MGLFTLAHSRAAYRADLAIYSSAVVLLAGVLLWAGPPELHAEMLGACLGGLLGWSFLEYLLHRFVLHGLEPFRSWHAEHHDRPTALLGTPTVFSAALIALLVFLPGAWLAGVWRSTAITLGVTAGYLAYSFTHHALHHWRAGSGWLKQRKLSHARHHHQATRPVCYGVTTSFWDHVFRSAGPRHTVSPPRPATQPVPAPD